MVVFADCPGQTGCRNRLGYPFAGILTYMKRAVQIEIIATGNTVTARRNRVDHTCSDNACHEDMHANSIRASGVI